MLFIRLRSFSILSSPKERGRLCRDFPFPTFHFPLIKNGVNVLIAGFLHLTSILVGEPTSLAYRLLAPPRSRKALLSLALNRYAYPCRKLNKKPLKARLYNKKIYKFFSSHFLYKSWRLDFVLAIFCSILNSLISLWFPLSRTSGTSNPRYSLGFVY